MKIILVMLAKNEADVIGSTLRWHLSNGVDHAIVADHESSDATPDIIGEFGSNVTCVRRSGPYYQGALTTDLIRIAKDKGADWVIPCDADELWTAGDLASLRDAITSSPYDVVRVPVINFIPTRLDDLAQKDPVRRIQYKVRSPPKIPRLPWVLKSHPGKVMFRTDGFRQILMGNHDVEHDSRNRGRLPGMVINHYPLRSREHFFTKVTQGGAALEAMKDVPRVIGSHWRQWYARHKEGKLGREWDRLAFGRLRLGALQALGVIQHDRSFVERYSTMIARSQS